MLSLCTFGSIIFKIANERVELSATTYAHPLYLGCRLWRLNIRPIFKVRENEREMRCVSMYESQLKNRIAWRERMLTLYAIETLNTKLILSRASRASLRI